MRLLRVAATDRSTGSRVGGRPPAGVDLACSVCGGPAGYVLTLGPDVLGPTVGDRALSLLACADMTCRFAGPQGGCSSLLVAHADTPRIDGTDPEDDWAGRALETDATDDEDTADDDPDPNSDQSKVGGAPGYLQSWGYEAGPALEAEGRAFLAQWSEVSYRDDMGDGTYPFLFGTVYLFAARADGDGDGIGEVDLATVRGFWQNA